jgi:chromosome segregation ATPase
MNRNKLIKFLCLTVVTFSAMQLNAGSKRGQSASASPQQPSRSDVPQSAAAAVPAAELPAQEQLKPEFVIQQLCDVVTKSEEQIDELVRRYVDQEQELGQVRAKKDRAESAVRELEERLNNLQVEKSQNETSKDDLISEAKRDLASAREEHSVAVERLNQRIEELRLEANNKQTALEHANVSSELMIRAMSLVSQTKTIQQRLEGLRAAR